MSRKFTDLQLFRNLVEPEDYSAMGASKQAVLNMLSLLYERGPDIPQDRIIDAIASAYGTEYDFGGND